MANFYTKFSATLAAIALSSGIAAHADNARLIGYGTGNDKDMDFFEVDLVKYGNFAQHRYGICIPKADVAKAGKIIAVRAGLPLVHIKNVEVQFCSSREGEPFLTQKYDNNKVMYGYNYIKLDNPLDASTVGSDLYIYIKMNVDSNIRMPYEPLEAKNTKADYWNYKGDFVHYSTNAYFNKALTAPVMLVTEGTDAASMPQYDLSLGFLRAPFYGNAGEDTMGKVKVSNTGSKTINTFTIVGTCEGNEVYRNIYNETLATGEAKMIEIGYNVPELGKKHIEWTVESVDGNADEVADNNLCSLDVELYEDVYHRNVLVEVETGSYCPNCPTGHNRLENAMAGYEEHINVVNHFAYDVNYANSSAGYVIDNETWKSAVRPEFAPAFIFDRMSPTGPTAQLQWIIASGMKNNIINQYLRNPAYVNIDFLESYYDEGSRELGLSVSGKFKKDFGPNVKINAFVVQSNFTGVQAMPNQSYKNDYVHMDTYRAYITNDFFGDPITVDAEGNYSADYTFELQNKYGKVSITDLDNVDVVVFISEYVGEEIEVADYSHFQVLQSEKINLGKLARNEYVGVGTVLAPRTTNGKTFDLSGRAVNADAKGLQIRDGKKYMKF